LSIGKLGAVKEIGERWRKLGGGVVNCCCVGLELLLLWSLEAVSEFWRCFGGVSFSEEAGVVS
jgi:hypothetical protein